jgi:hypothetical protein
VLDALADGEDVGIAGAHVVADQNAAVDVEAGAASELDVGPDADGDDHEIGGYFAAVRQADAFRPFGAKNLLGLALREESDAALVEIALQQLAGGRIELTLHECRHQVHDRDRHAAPLQPPGRFEAEQSAADDHGTPWGRRGDDHLLDVGDVAEGADAGKL